MPRALLFSRGCKSVNSRALVHDARSMSSGLAAPLRVGTDIVAVAEVARSIELFGDRYLRRVYTDAELEYCLSRGPNAPLHLAARFAAKEAALKALRLGDRAVSWRD